MVEFSRGRGREWREGGQGPDGAGRAGGGWCGVGVPEPHTMHKLPIERQSPSRGIWRTPHMHHMPRPAGAGRNGRFCRTTVARGRAVAVWSEVLGRRAGAGWIAQARRVRSPAPASSLRGSGESLPGYGEFASRLRRVRFPAPASRFPDAASSLPGCGEFASRLRRVRFPAPSSRFPDAASSLPRSRKDPRRNRGESGRRGLLIGVHCPGQPIVVAAQAQAAPRHIRGDPRAGSVRAERPCTGHHCRVLS
jgi:hypothetical protein